MLYQMRTGVNWHATAAASLSLLLLSAFRLQAAERVFAPYAAVRPILQTLADALPAGLKNADEGKWNEWRRREDKAIRARLELGDLDSTVNLLLFGTSFTTQPRIRI